MDRPSAIQFSPDGVVLIIGNVYGEVTVVHCGYDNGGGTDEEIEMAVYNVWKSQALWQIVLKKQIAKVAAKGDDVHRRDKANAVTKGEITVIKFSPSGNIVAVGCRDTVIYVLTTLEVQ